MDLSRWMTKASAEEGENVHKFNAQFEHEHLSTSPELSKLWNRFTAHLHSKPDSESAAYWLQHFSGSLPGSRLYQAKPEEMPAFCGPNVKPDGRILSTQQAFRSIKPALANVLPSIAPELTELETSVHNAPGRTSARPLGRRAWDDWYDEVMRKAEAVKKTAVPRPAHRSPLISGPSLRPVSGRIRKGGHDRLRVMWFTFAEELDEAIGGFPTKTPLGRAAVATYRRIISGVFNEKDLLDDISFISSNPDVACFRVVFDVRIKLASGQEGSVRQPTIFAQGDPVLFVTAKPDTDRGGRTARLGRVRCGHVRGRCKCYKEGLPEVVLSRAVALGSDEIEIHDVAILMHRHLKSISPPDPNELRQQKTLERSSA